MSDGACIPNIGPAGIRRRLAIAGLCAVLVAWAFGRLVMTGAPPLRYAGLAPLLLGTTLGWYQAREKT